MVLSPYFSDEEVITSLRQQFPKEQQYTINFGFWLNNAQLTADGYIVQIMSRKFLIHSKLGFVIKEL